jgi:hypothetical protein
LSEFRNGKANLSTASLKTLLDAMEKLAPGSRAYFCSVMAGEPLKDYTTAVDIVNALPPEELSQLLVAIAARMKQPTVSQIVPDACREYATA